MIKKAKFIVFIFFLISVATYGRNNVRFELIVPEKVYSGQEFTLIFRLENAEGQDFRAPEFSGCNGVADLAVSRPSQIYSNGGIGCLRVIQIISIYLETDQKEV